MTLDISNVHTLPHQPTRFIGRAAEIAEIAGLLNDPACRLLTLVGPGGIGKTRLSLEAAKQFATPSQHNRGEPGVSFPHGIFFVPLAPLTAAANIVTTVANVLRITFSGSGTPHEELVSYLSTRQLLLVMDNFEHVLDGVDLVSAMLDAAPGVKILATSRERLKLAAERVVTVQGMPVPPVGQVENIEEFGSLLLFQQIAQKVDWGFSLASDQTACAARICQLTEGIPLAIELAAAWIRALSCQEIADELERSFEFLADTLAYVPARHRSLRVVFEYSWNRLTEEERNVFQRMAVFRGGFRKEAAQQVTGASPRALLSLVDKSLLRHDPDGRYHVHELLRQFAGEKLADNPEAEATAHTLHGACYADFLQQQEPHFKARGDRQLEVVQEIDTELDNVRQMWQWATTHQQLAIIDQAAHSLYHYYLFRTMREEAVERFQDAATAVENGSASPHLRAKILGMLSSHAGFLGLEDLSHSAAQQGLSEAQAVDARPEMARCLRILGGHAIYHGDLATAKHYLEQSVEIYETLDELEDASMAWLFLGWTHQLLQDYDKARHYYQHLLTISQQRGSQVQAAWALLHLGSVDNLLGRYDLARQYCTDALVIFEATNELTGIVAAHKTLGNVLCGLGEFGEARQHFRAALTAFVEHGMVMTALTLSTLAGVASFFALEGDVTRAVELAVLIRKNVHSNHETIELAEALYTELEAELPPVVFQTAREHGETLDFEPVVRQLLVDLAVEPEDTPLPAEALAEHDLQMLQQISDALLAGDLFDHNTSNDMKDHAQTLVSALGMTLEKEKARVMAEFMDSASHDLRTPLTIINTSLYLLERIADPDQQKDRLQVVKDQVAHLQTIIENLIAMSRLDGGADFEIRPIGLKPLLVSIRESDIIPLTEGRDVTVTFAIPQTALMVQADADDLQQALGNLIENAVRYTPDTGSVNIRAYVDRQQAVVEVSDTGSGIDATDLPHIFERFYRADKARTERGRAGLGLAIAKKIVEAHKGHIHVVSTPGNGSTFRVALPLADNQVILGSRP